MKKVSTPWDEAVKRLPRRWLTSSCAKCQQDTYHQGYATALASPLVQGLVEAAREGYRGLDAFLTTPLRGPDADKAIGIAKEARNVVRVALAAYEEATKKEEAHGS